MASEHPAPNVDEALGAFSEALGAIVSDLGAIEEMATRCPMPLVITDGSGRRMVSLTLSRLLGRPSAELEACAESELVHPHDLAKLRGAHRLSVRSEQGGGIVCRYLCGDGSWRALSWRFGPPGPSGLTWAFGEDLGCVRHG